MHYIKINLLWIDDSKQIAERSLNYYIQNMILLLEWSTYNPNLNPKEMSEQILRIN